jgi:hypothetical protein
MTEITNCNICYETVQDAVLCPKCSKPFCRECIVSWLNSRHNTCPFCRTIVSGIDAFVRCFWMQDLKDHLARQREEQKQNAEYSKLN